MMVEFWDRTRLSAQEGLFGRHRDSGAPLGLQRETDLPRFAGDFESHIARANPRTPGRLIRIDPGFPAGAQRQVPHAVKADLSVGR